MLPPGAIKPHSEYQAGDCACASNYFQLVVAEMTCVFFWHFYKSRNNIDSLRSSSEQFGTLTKTNISSSLVLNKTKDPGKDTKNVKSAKKDLNIFCGIKNGMSLMSVFVGKNLPILEVERLRKRPATLPRPIELPQVWRGLHHVSGGLVKGIPTGLGRIPTGLRESQPGFWLRASKKTAWRIPVGWNWMWVPRNVISVIDSTKMKLQFWGHFCFPVFTSIKNKRDQMVRVGNDDSPAGQLTVVPSQLTLRRGRGTPEPDFWQMDEA